MLNQLLSGAIILGFLAIALFFFRFWRRMRDPLFAGFAAAFVLFAVERIVLVWEGTLESKSFVYLIRLAAFLVIVFSVIAKNREKK